VRRRAGPIVVVAIYVASALWVTAAWWAPLGTRLTAVNQRDAILFSWLVTWTPHALGSGRPPLLATAQGVPDGINLMWNNGMALPALLFAPVTAAWGGLATVTVLIAVGLAGSATTAFGALRALGATTLPAALGGATFGFSPAMVVQSLGGHPNLVFNVLAPVLVLLAVRLAVQERPRMRIAVLLGLLAAAQLLIGEEVLFLTGIVVSLLLLLLAVAHPVTARRRAPRFLALAAVAFGTFLLLGGPMLAFQLLGPLHQRGSPFPIADFGVDLVNYVVPTAEQLIASPDEAARTLAFPGGPEEHGGFLGWPLLVVATAALALGRSRTRVWVPIAVAAVIAVLAMGEELRIDGQPTEFTLPWMLLAGLPGFEHVIASRLAMFTVGLVGAGLAFALTSLRETPRITRAVATTLVVVALLPLVPAPLPAADAAAVPAFFTTPAARLCPGGSVLVLPFPAQNTTEPLRWQAMSGMAFAMPGGYFIGPAANGHAYLGGQPTHTGNLLQAVQYDGEVRAVTPSVRSAFAYDVRRWRACAALLGPAPHVDALRDQITALVGHEPEAVGGVLLWAGMTAG
jgi:hypothetical protein